MSEADLYKKHIGDTSYEGALEAAGAVVEEFKFFGSYQGNWWARVVYEGQRGWVRGSYGSCSGCDALQGTFDYDFGDEYKWDDEWSKRVRKTDEEIAGEREQFAEFGRGYLDLMTQAEAEKHASADLEWDMEAHEHSRRYNRKHSSATASGTAASCLPPSGTQRATTRIACTSRRTAHRPPTTRPATYWRIHEASALERVAHSGLLCRMADAWPRSRPPIPPVAFLNPWNTWQEPSESCAS